MILLEPWCCNAVNDYGIEEGTSWGLPANGKMPYEQQKLWFQKNCPLNENVANGTCPKGKLISSLIFRV